MALTLVRTTPAGAWAGARDGAVLGPQSQSPGNAEGNLLVAFGAWSTSSAPGFSGVVPASSVCDQQGNWWQLAADSGGSCPGARVAAWVCANPLAIPETGWWSFALQGYAQGAQWLTAEFSGLPSGYAPVIDFAVSSSTGTGTGTAITLSAVTGQADYCLGAATGASASLLGLTAPGTPWTTLQTTLLAPAATDMVSSCSYASYASGGTATATWAAGTASGGPAAMAAVMIGISQASSPPAQANPDYPVVKTEAALGAAPGDPSQAIADAAWTDMSARTLAKGAVAGITVTRGKDYEQATPEAGELGVLMSNVDGAFDPLWPGGVYYSSALNENMSFQSGVSPWIAHTGTAITLSQSSAQAFASGVNATAQWSMQMSVAGTVSHPGAESEFVPVSPNYPYTASSWFFQASGSAVSVQSSVNWYTSAQSLISGISGAAVALPAGSWTQASVSGTPPAAAAYARLIPQVAGTVASSTTFWLAECALAQGTAPASTGLVRLGTPVRVSAFWQGRRYPVGSGFVERWPQGWPDMPQWGFSALVATDTVGVANSANLPSAVQGEILADAPYACLPFSEQYSTTTSSLNGPQDSATNAAGLIAVNTAPANQQTAVYISGDQPVTTGNSLSFLGDSGTGMGVSSYGSIDTSKFRGSGAVYGPDPGLPAISASAGMSAEFWVSVPTLANQSAAEFLQFAQLFGPPWIGEAGAAGLSPGWVMSAGLYLPATSGSPQLFVQTSALGSVPTSGTVSTMNFGGLNHVVISCPPGGTAVAYLNGVAAIGGVALAETSLTAVTFGQADYSYGQAFNLWNYSQAYGAVYPYPLGAGRVSEHYASGATGFSGDTIAQRFGRYLAWGNLGLQPAGPGSAADAFQLSAAYSTDGSSLASALNADAQGSGAAWYASAAGNLVILPRPAQWNQPPSVTFGDSVNPLAGEIPYTPGLAFDYDNTYLKNIVQATLSQGPSTSIAPVDRGIASIAQYFARGPQTLTVNGSSPEDAYDAASWSLSQYQQPQMRARTLTVDAASTQAFTAVLTTDLADVATVNRRPLGAPSYSLPVIVEQVTHSIGPGVWNTAYQLSPYVASADVLTADVSGSDTLGSTTLAW